MKGFADSETLCSPPYVRLSMYPAASNTSTLPQYTEDQLLLLPFHTDLPLASLTLHIFPTWQSQSLLSGPAKADLPPPLGALSTLGGRPAFLDPAATRPIAQSIHRSRPAAPPPSSTEAARPVKGKAQPGDWDIARMAPKVKGGLQQVQTPIPLE